jgi:hypothetical protein
MTSRSRDQRKLEGLKIGIRNNCVVYILDNSPLCASQRVKDGGLPLTCSYRMLAQLPSGFLDACKIIHRRQVK